MGYRNSYKIVFRNSTVVDDRIIYAKTMIKAIKKARRLTEPGMFYEGWSVYSVTIY